jgi:hypothetical protein
MRMVTSHFSLTVPCALSLSWCCQIVQTPAVVLIEMYFYNKHISARTIMSISVLLVGVVLASIYDPQVSADQLPAGVAMLRHNAQQQER